MRTEHKIEGSMDRQMIQHHYMMLALNLALSLVIMYIAMFAMISSWGEFVQNINFFYMALVMWAPMAAVMLLTMKSMYRNTKLNVGLYVVFAAVFVLSLAGIRAQGFVGDRQFVRSMIPHHSGAILMCGQASIKDAEIRQLCFGPSGIVESQKREIAQMKAILKRL
ncbi:DUF305 domain-containing protein [Phenylobacterium sp. J426]|uniref:DUF305 domain-containing protein n=2 Tax=Caulobacteraceae TaxID=76892 RepID=UPI000A8E59DA|nr:DUF305 domain-containing protein [Phenylobacterium sp. J426]MCR5876800.1 DUF305 domain-containing protein [Phenylobacterium sp. J426]MCR5876919.1 DUF305 domain-containing protein [Phenylobacterium sp. J426]